MKGFAPALVVCLAGLALILVAAVAWAAAATVPPARGGQAVGTRKAPLPPKRERGWITGNGEAVPVDKTRPVRGESLSVPG